jgi:hypothetical protein
MDEEDSASRGLARGGTELLHLDDVAVPGGDCRVAQRHPIFAAEVLDWTRSVATNGEYMELGHEEAEAEGRPQNGRKEGR